MAKLMWIAIFSLSVIIAISHCQGFVVDGSMGHENGPVSELDNGRVKMFSDISAGVKFKADKFDDEGNEDDNSED